MSVATLQYHVDTPKTIAEVQVTGPVTQSSPVLAVKTRLIWRARSPEVELATETVLNKVESGRSISRSTDYSAMAMKSLLAIRTSRISPKKLAKKLAKDSAQGID